MMLGGADSLKREILRQDCEHCRKCPHGSTRKQVAFSKDDPLSTVAFVGEAPGADEDEQGVPFVGQAGQYLDRMVTAMRSYAQAEGIAFPDEPYFCNVLKCRPPGNKLLADRSDVEACREHLWRQIKMLPNLRVIVAVGKTAAIELLGFTEKSTPRRQDVTMAWLRRHVRAEPLGGQPLNHMLGNASSYSMLERGVRVFVVYHPSYLMRNPHDAKLRLKAWDDLKLAVEALR